MSEITKPGLLFVGNFLSNKGFPLQICEVLAEKFKLRGYRVVTVSCHVGRLRRLVDMLLATFRFRRGYHLAHVDVFSGFAFYWAEAVCALLKILKKPFILTLHGGGLPEFSQKHPNRVRRLLNAARIVTAPSGYLRETLKPLRENIRYISNGIDVDIYPFKLRRAPRPKIVWLRAFQKIYNPWMAVRVVHALRADNKDIQLHMIGPDKDGSLGSVQRLANDLEVNSRITFSGLINKAEIPRYLNEGDIFINTTDIDNTPVSVIEAMACGMCIVSTNVGGIPYLLKHEVDALLVPQNDAEEMAKAIRRLLIDHELAMSISANARVKAEQFDWSIVLPQWEALFTEVDSGGHNVLV